MDSFSILFVIVFLCTFNRHKYMSCPILVHIRNFVFEPIDLISFSYYGVAFIAHTLDACISVDIVWLAKSHRIPYTNIYTHTRNNPY